MSLSTVPITGSVVLPDGGALTNGIVKFTLSAADYEGGSVIVGTTVEATLTGGDLQAGTVLWRNSTGVAATWYKVEVRSEVTAANGLVLNRVHDLGTIQVGAAASYVLSDLLATAVQPPPYAGPVYMSALARTLVEEATAGAMRGVLQIADDFAARADFVTWAATAAPSVGTVVHAAGLAYRFIGSGTAIADLPGWVPNGPAYLTMWPATVAGLKAACAWCANGKLLVPAGTYTYATAATDLVTDLSNIAIEADGTGAAVFAITGSITYFRCFRGTNVTFRGLTFTLDSTTTGNAVLFYFAANDVTFDRCTINGNATWNGSSYPCAYHVIQCASTGSYSGITVTGCAIDKVHYLVLNSNTSTISVSRIRVEDNKFTNAAQEPCGFNAPAGSMNDLLIRGNNFFGHQGGTTLRDGHFIGLANVGRAIISDNLMVGDCREGIHIENGAKNVTISGNIISLDLTSWVDGAGIAVLPGLDGAGTMPEMIAISQNIAENTGGSNGWGITVYDFTSGLEGLSANYVNIQGNVVRGFNRGYDLTASGARGLLASENTAVACAQGYLLRHDATRQVKRNVSVNCTYGVVTQAFGSAEDHTFVNCAHLCGFNGMGAVGGPSLSNFTVVQDDRNFTTAEVHAYTIMDGVDALARMRGALSISVSSLQDGAFYLHSLDDLVWDGTALTDVPVMQRAAGVSGAISVSAGELTATLTAVAAGTSVRTSARFEGTAFINAAHI